MVKEIVWSPSAEKDLNDILSYVSIDDQPRVAKFIARMREAVDKLAIFPQIGTKYDKIKGRDVRDYSHWPYRIIYTFDDKRVYVLRVMHGARNLKGPLD